MSAALVLRDVHIPPAPPWWPPAPGWWLLGAALLVAGGAWWWLDRRRKRRRQAAARLFDEGIAVAATPAGRLAVASELLRRAARRVHADADRLEGEAWLAFLDGTDHAFTAGSGRHLLDGPFRRELDPAEAEHALEAARRRFVGLMESAR
jgi:hypothetical protein